MTTLTSPVLSLIDSTLYTDSIQLYNYMYLIIILIIVILLLLLLFYFMESFHPIQELR